MVTILLQTIIELLTGWKDSFFTWANEVGDNIAAIKTNTDSLPDIKSNTDDIKDNTAAVITPISNINTNVSAITPDVATIKTDTAVIKNNANAIMTSSGQTAAFAEDIADNTLDCSNRLVTIGSDTTQIRADSGSLAADVSEIKSTLGLYLYNTIVTEDAEGSVSNFDTDLKDYLQKAVVTIPADAGGISDMNVYIKNSNMLALPFKLYTSIPDSVSNMFFIKKGQYIFRFGNSDATSWRYAIRLKDLDGNNLGDLAHKPNSELLWYTNMWMNSGNITRRYLTLDIVEDCYIRILYAYGDTTASSIFEITRLNYGSTSLPYEDYSYNSFPITFTTPITDGAEVDLLSGIAKINTSPVTYDSFTPIAIRTYKGVNNVYSNIGDMSATYRETLKHYLEKQEEN